MRLLRVCLLFLAAGAYLSCAGPESSREADGSASLFDDLEDDDRETVLIEPAEAALDSYDFDDALIDTVVVRSSVADTVVDASIVEVLVKGYFPDGCTKLHEVEQIRSGAEISVRITTRRPKNTFCTQAIRPYRYFFELEDALSEGQYTLLVNERSIRFEV